MNSAMQLVRLYFFGSNGHRAWKVREEEETEWRKGTSNGKIFNKVKVAVELVEKLRDARGCTIQEAAREWDAALQQQTDKKPMGVASFCRYDSWPKLLQLVGLAANGN